jgi:hypothetical protein
MTDEPRVGRIHYASAMSTHRDVQVDCLLIWQTRILLFFDFAVAWRCESLEI